MPRCTDNGKRNCTKLQHFNIHKILKVPNSKSLGKNYCLHFYMFVMNTLLF